MAKLSTDKAPAAAPGGFTWETIESIVEVPDELAHELLKIADAGFHEVIAEVKAEVKKVEAAVKKAVAKKPVTEPDPDAKP